MTKAEAFEKAVARIKGQEIALGTTVGTMLHPLTWKLMIYDADMAVCEQNGITQSFPRSEIFDVKKIINVANHYLNLGFWKEGMESVILEIPSK